MKCACAPCSLHFASDACKLAPCAVSTTKQNIEQVCKTCAASTVSMTVGEPTELTSRVSREETHINTSTKPDFMTCLQHGKALCCHIRSSGDSTLTGLPTRRLVGPKEAVASRPLCAWGAAMGAVAGVLMVSKKEAVRRRRVGLRRTHTRVDASRRSITSATWRKPHLAVLVSHISGLATPVVYDLHSLAALCRHLHCTVLPWLPLLQRVAAPVPLLHNVLVLELLPGTATIHLSVCSWYQRGLEVLLRGRGRQRRCK